MTELLPGEKGWDQPLFYIGCEACVQNSNVLTSMSMMTLAVKRQIHKPRLYKFVCCDAMVFA